MAPRFVLAFTLSARCFVAAAQTTQPGAPASQPSRPEVSAAQLVAMAQQKKDAGALGEASQLVRAALESDPANTEAHLLAGEISFEARDYDAARDHFKLVLDVDPVNFRANLGYGKILNANRQYRQAANKLETAERVASDPQRMVDVRRALAYAYAGMGRVNDAVTKAEEAVKLDPQSLDARQTLVEIRLAAADRTPAQLEPALTDAEAYVQKNKDAVQQKPWDKERLQRLDSAYELLLSALRTLHNSFYERDLRRQVTNALVSGKQAEAAAALNRTAEVVSEQAALQLTLKEYDAVMLAAKAVEYEPKNLRYLENLASLYQRTNDRDMAVQTCRRILELKPDHEGARQYLEAVGESPASRPASEPSSRPVP
jgi:tetratricopeptide (TPR) repeat protein